MQSQTWRLGHSLKVIAETELTRAIQDEDTEREEQCPKFLRLCEMNWTKYISILSLRIMKHEKMNKVITLQDVGEKFNQYLENEIIRLNASLNNKPNHSSWNGLAEVSLVVLIVFKSRRVGQVERLKDTYFQKISYHDNNQDFVAGLTESGKLVCANNGRLEIVGGGIMLYYI